jgi:outer membrane lipoprotein-sorting protein
MKNILLTFALLLTTGFANAQPVTNSVYIDQAQGWLNNLKTAKAGFEQVDHYGRSLQGTFYINRPGRLRFEYDEPIEDYIVADGFQIHFYDGDSGQANSAPIGSTLADFILRDADRFGDKVNVEAINEDQNFVYITVSQADQPGMGTLTLNFQKQPWTLHSWQIIDAQGLTTSILLKDFQRDVSIDPSIFRMKNRNLNQ